MPAWAIAVSWCGPATTASNSPARQASMAAVAEATALAPAAAFTSPGRAAAAGSSPAARRSMAGSTACRPVDGGGALQHRRRAEHGDAQPRRSPAQRVQRLQHDLGPDAVGVADGQRDAARRGLTAAGPAACRSPCCRTPPRARPAAACRPALHEAVAVVAGGEQHGLAGVHDARHHERRARARRRRRRPTRTSGMPSRWR